VYFSTDYSAVIFVADFGAALLVGFFYIKITRYIFLFSRDLRRLGLAL
jgi:hypothetical protein